MKTGILFDLDGTLLDTLQDLADSVNAVLRMYNCPERTLEEVRQFVGNGAHYLIRCALPGRESDPTVEEVLAAYQKYYAAHAQEKTAPYAGVAQALKTVSQKYPVAIVSNKPDGAVKALCRDYFPGIYARGETADCPRKPAPDMVHKAMKEIGVDACIYVGDSEVDVLTAKNAGVPCLSVTWGFRDEALLKQAGAVHFCRTPDALPQMLDSLI